MGWIWDLGNPSQLCASVCVRTHDLQTLYTCYMTYMLICIINMYIQMYIEVYYIYIFSLVDLDPAQ